MNLEFHSVCFVVRIDKPGTTFSQDSTAYEGSCRAFLDDAEIL
jgi:hypothetical protein